MAVDTKRNSSRAVWIIVFLVTAFVALGGLSRLLGAKEAVAWRQDLHEARSESAAGRKPVFIYFTASWCPPCQQMRRTIWADQRVAGALAAGYVPVKIDIDRHPDVAMEYQVETIPWFAVLDAGGSPVKAWGQMMEADDFLKWLKE